MFTLSLIRSIALSAVILGGGLTVSPALALLKDVRGITSTYEKRILKTSEIAQFYPAKKQGRHDSLGLMQTACPPPPNCPPCPPTVPGTFVVNQNPHALPGAFFPNTSASNSLATPPQTLGVVFTAGDRATLQGSSYRLGNFGGCVGLEQYVLASNYGWVTYDLLGNRDAILNVESTSFSNSDSDFSMFFDSQEAQLRYDKFTNRFIFAMDLFEFNGVGPGGFSVGISDSGIITPDTQWTIVNVFDASRLPTTQGCPADQSNYQDYTRVAVDKNAIYVGENWFALSNGFFSSTSGYVIQKKSLINKGLAVITSFPDVIGYPGEPDPYRDAATTLMPVMNFDDDDDGFGYFIGQDPLLFGKLILFRVNDPGSTSPSLSPLLPIDVPATGRLLSGPTCPTFLGNLYGVLGNLQASDDRLQMAHIRNKQLYTVHTILLDQNGNGTPTGDRLGARWYQIDLTGDRTGRGGKCEKETTLPALVQAGTLWDKSSTNPINYFNNSIMTNKMVIWL